MSARNRTAAGSRMETGRLREMRKKTFRALRSRSSSMPLTLFGSLVFIAAITLLSSAYISSDSYAAAAGFAALLLSMGFGISVSLLPIDGMLEDLRWNSGPVLSAEKTNSTHSLSMGNWKLPMFLRLHVRIRGKLSCGEETGYSFYAEYRLEGREELPISFTPPMPGRLTLHAEFFVKDVFGLAKKRLGEVRDRRVTVLPLSESLSSSNFPTSSTTADDNSRKKRSDQEKIFIRDYQPGDLARDINWKASGRINKLLTRIPPESESKTRLLQVYAVSQRPPSSAEMKTEYLFRLSYMKALISGFIEAVYLAKSENNKNSDSASQLIDLHLNSECIEIRDDESLVKAMDALSAWLPSPTFDITEIPQDRGEILAFSHYDCPTLPHFLDHVGRDQVYLYYVKPWKGGDYNRLMRYSAERHFTPRRQPGRLKAYRPGDISPSPAVHSIFEYTLRMEW